MVSLQTMADRVLTDKEVLEGGHLQSWQEEALLSNIPFKTLCVSRQSGKSLLVRAMILRELFETPNAEILVLATTLRQVRNLHFRPLFLSNEPLVDKSLIKSINKTDMIVELVNGARIMFASTENLQALRGLTLNSVYCDEAAFMPLDDVLEVIEPIISARQGRIVLISTPKGKNAFYRYLMKGLKNSPFFVRGFRSWLISIEDDIVVIPNKQARIERAKAVLSGPRYAQEYLSSFDALEGIVYKEYHDQLNQSNQQLVLVDPITKKNKALYIGLDLNVAKMTAVVAQEFVDPITKIREVHVVDELVQTNTNTAKMVEAINRKYGQFKGRIWVCPDATGRARKTAATETDIQILERAGFKILANKINPMIADRVNTVNNAFCAANGSRRLYIAPHCKETIHSITNQTYDPKTNQPEKGKGENDISGPSDSLGYLVMQRLPMTQNSITAVNALGY